MVIMNFESDFIEGYNELVATLNRYEYRPKTKKLDLDMKSGETPPAKPFVEEASKLELKDLPPRLRYPFLVINDIVPVNISRDLSGQQVVYLMSILKRFK